MNIATAKEIEEYLADKYAVAGTGSSKYDWSEDKVTANLGYAIEDLRAAHSNLVLISGMALGWDRAIAQMGIMYDIPWIAIVPSPDYGKYYWGREGLLEMFDQYLEKAILVEYVNPSHVGSNGRPGHSNFDRNQRMVDLAAHFLVYDSNSSGTKDCVIRINRTHKSMQLFGGSEL